MTLPPVVYLAGPFRASTGWLIAQHVRRAEAVALEAWTAGWAVICPHLNTANFHGALPDEVWLRGDLALLLRCDAVLMLPGWRASAGAREERTVAQSFGLPVVERLEDLAALAGAPHGKLSAHERRPPAGDLL